MGCFFLFWRRRAKKQLKSTKKWLDSRQPIEKWFVSFRPIEQDDKRVAIERERQTETHQSRDGLTVPSSFLDRPVKEHCQLTSSMDFYFRLPFAFLLSPFLSSVRNRTWKRRPRERERESQRVVCVCVIGDRFWQLGYLKVSGIPSVSWHHTNWWARTLNDERIRSQAFTRSAVLAVTVVIVMETSVASVRTK